MKLYFVRHGESELNQKRIHQYPHTPLSTLGEKQALFVAKRFLTLPIDRIIASNFLRTQQTAQVISTMLGKSFETNELLREIERPTEIVGTHYDDLKTKNIKKQMKENAHDPNWHYSDEENFYDVKKRAEKFIEFVTDLKSEHILIVSHGLTIKMIVGLLAFGDLLTSQFFQQFEVAFRQGNTGITVCEKRKGIWKVTSWNDLSHLS